MLTTDLQNRCHSGYGPFTSHDCGQITVRRFPTRMVRTGKAVVASRPLQRKAQHRVEPGTNSSARGGGSLRKVARPRRSGAAVPIHWSAATKETETTPPDAYCALADRRSGSLRATDRAGSGEQLVECFYSTDYLELRNRALPCLSGSV